VTRLTIVCVLLLATTCAWAGTKKEDATERLKSAGDVLHEIMNAPDKGIPAEVIDGAKCIAVVPRMLKGGFIFGAKHGKGVATCRTAKGWSAPAFFTVTGGSWGLQIGVEGVDLVMMIMNQKGMQDLLSNKFQIGAQASASGGPVGRHASAGTDWKMDTEILTYSRSKGLFAGISLEGSWIEQDKSSTEAIYGKHDSFKSALTGKLAAPPQAAPFLNAVGYVEEQAKKAA
jgi:lipid-binding SYLF domain-containing protein